MEFGGFGFARGRSLLALALVLVCGLQFKGWAQQAPATSPVENTVPALPPEKPIAEAAMGTTRSNSEAAKPAQSGAPASSAAPAIEDLSSLRLGAGDLLEVSVYNVPELATKARVGSSGDVYLPLIDYVHVGDLTVEEAQTMIQKRLEDGGFVRSAHVTIFIDESASQGVTILGDVMKPGIYPAA
jgi:protein involved in polysaccharide export with SLBB domain